MARLCIAIDLAFRVKVEQHGPDDFRVTYGKEVHNHLSYEAAATQFGLSVFHALACDTKLDNAERARPNDVRVRHPEED